MGRAIVREPRAFLMDEPLSNLDAKLRVGMRASLAAAARAARRDDGLRHARPDRGDDARTAGRGDARRRHRAGRRAAGALRRAAEPLRRGIHRLARDEPRRGDVEGDDGRASAASAVPLDAANGGPPPGSAPVVLGIRPEAFEDGRARGAALPRLRVQVEVLEELGADTHVFLPRRSRDARRSTRVEDDEDATLLATRATLFTARVDPRTRGAAGRGQSSQSTPSRFHFFDARDGSEPSAPDRARPARATRPASATA